MFRCTHSEMEPNKQTLLCAASVSPPQRINVQSCAAACALNMFELVPGQASRQSHGQSSVPQYRRRAEKRSGVAARPSARRELATTSWNHARWPLRACIYSHVSASKHMLPVPACPAPLRSVSRPSIDGRLCTLLRGPAMPPIAGEPVQPLHGAPTALLVPVTRAICCRHLTIESFAVVPTLPGECAVVARGSGPGSCNTWPTVWARTPAGTGAGHLPQ